VLFIDARKLGVLVDRTRRELTDEEVQKIADTYHAWRGEDGAGEYADVAGFCKSASMDDIRKHGHVLTPGRHVGTGDIVKDDESFEERMTRLTTELGEELSESANHQATMREQLKLIGFPIAELEQ
jgi:type I restriction enzyme M protein